LIQEKGVGGGCPTLETTDLFQVGKKRCGEKSSLWLKEKDLKRRGAHVGGRKGPETFSRPKGKGIAQWGLSKTDCRRGSG